MSADELQVDNRSTRAASALAMVPLGNIDFVGPLPMASDGSRYISDYFSERIDAIGTPNKEASTVAEVLFKVSYILMNNLA